MSGTFQRLPKNDLLFDFEKQLQCSLPSSITGQTPQEFIYKFRYPFEYPVLAAIAGFCYGHFQLEKLQLSKKPARLRYAFIGSKTVTFMLAQLLYSACITGFYGAFQTDSMKSRFAAGALTSYGMYLYTRNYVKSLKLGPIFSVASVIFKYVEQPEDFSARFRNFLEYEKKRKRAQKLLDPSRDDYEEMVNYLEIRYK